MQRDEIFAILTPRISDLRGRGIKTLVLFGPAARGDAAPGSSVDFLVELFPPVTFDRYREVSAYLHELLGHPVEVIMENPRHPLIWAQIQDEAIFLWGPEE